MYKTFSYLKKRLSFYSKPSQLYGFFLFETSLPRYIITSLYLARNHNLIDYTQQSA